MNTTPIVNSPGKVIGGGEIGSKNGTRKASFCFTIHYKKCDSEAEDALIYQDYEENFCLRSTSFDLLVVENSHAWFTGTGTMDDGQMVRFTIEIYTAPDIFKIYIPSLYGYEAGGKLMEGSLTIFN